MSPRNCLSEAELSDFVLGKLPAEAIEEITGHVEECPDCQVTLASAAGQSDTVLSELRKLVPIEKFTQEPAYQQAIAKLGAGKDSPDGPAAASTPAPQGGPEGLVFGEYTVLEKIGAGGMGQVYKAEHRRMKRIVALKVLPRESMKSPDAVKRFQREVQAAARLEHPNIVTAHDAGESDGLHFLVMQFVDGQDLSSLSKKRGPLPVADVVNYIRQTACGLAYAHSKGIVHRDIKPGNLLLDKEGVVKILDMGLARFDDGASAIANAEEGLTHSGQVMGTVDYMAPEQAFDTRSADARADVYSLGCTLYRLLIGKSLFTGDSLMQKLLAHRESTIPNLCELRSDVPARFNAIFQKLVAKQPKDRYQTMNEVVADLDACRTAMFALRRAAAANDEPSSASESSILTFPEETANQAPKDLTIDYASANPASAKVSSTRQPPNKRRGWLLAAAGGAAAAILAGVIIILQHPDGTQTKIEVAEGTKVILPGDNPAKPTATGKVSPAPGDYALALDGTSQYVEVPSLRYPGQGAFTVEAYVTPATDEKGANGKVFVFSGEGLMAIEQKGSSWQGVAGKTKPMPYLASRTLQAGKRSHVAVEFDGTIITLFVDGKKFDQQAGKFSTDAFRSELFIGGLRQKDGRPTRLFSGQVDEIRVSNVLRYDRDFSPTARFESDSNTLALYHCDEGSGDTLRDSSGNNHHGKIVGATWVRVDSSSSGVKSESPDPLASAPSPFDALRREDIPLDDLQFAGNGDPSQVPAEVVAIVRIDAPNSQTPTNNSWSNPYTMSAISPDGRMIAFTANANRAVIRSFSAGKFEEWVLKLPSGTKRWAFGPDNKLLASGHNDGSIKLWNVSSGEAEATLTGHVGEISTLAISPDGKTLASGSIGGGIGDGTVRLWDLTTRKQRVVIPGHDGYVRLAFHPDGRTFVTALGKGKIKQPIRLWDVTTGNELQGPMSGKGKVSDNLAFSPDGTTLVAADAGAELRMWEVATGRERTPIKTAHAGSVAFSLDGKTIATAGRKGGVQLWNVQSGKERKTIQIGPASGHINDLAFDPTGRYLVTANGNGTAYVVRVTETTAVNQSKPEISNPPLPPLAVTPSPFDALKREDVAVEALTTAGLGDPAKAPSELVAVLSIGNKWGIGTDVLAFSPQSGTMISILGGRHGVRFWNVATRLTERTFNFPEDDVFVLAISPDGQWLATTGSSPTIKIWDLATRTEKAALKGHTQQVRSLAFSPDGQTLASGSGKDDDGPVRLWDVASGTAKHVLKGHTYHVYVAFSPDGQQLVSSSGDKDGGMHLWDVATGRDLGTFPEQFTGSNTVTFSPNGQMIATGGLSGRVVVLDVATRKTITVLLRPERDRINSVAFSADNKTLAVGGVDGAVHLWDIATAKEVKKLQIGPPDGSINNVVYDATGRYLLTGNGNASVAVLRLASATPVSDSSPPKSSLASSAALSQHQMLTSLDYEWTAPEKVGVPFDIAASMPIAGRARLAVAGDGLTMYFALGSEPQAGIMMSSRDTTESPWKPFVTLNLKLGSKFRDDLARMPSISADGRILLFNAQGGADRGKNLWIVTRSNADQPFSTPINLPFPVANNGDAALSPDGLSLVFSTSDTAPADGNERLWLATRPVLDAPFETAVGIGSQLLSAERSGAHDPMFLPDGSGLLFRQGHAVLVSARNADGSFRPADEVTLQGPTGYIPDKFHPTLLPDGRTLYFAAHVMGGSATEMWMVRRVARQTTTTTGAAGPSSGKSTVVAPTPADPDRRAAAWVQNVGGEVTVVTAAGKSYKLKKGDLLPVGRFVVKTVYFQGPEVTDSGIENRRGLQQVESLTLHKGSADHLGDAGAAVIGDLPSLTKLIVNRSQFSSAGWTHIARLSKLKSLSVFGKNLTDQDLQSLKPLPLKELAVGTTGLTSAAVRIIADNWPDLESLEIHADNLTPESAEHLEKLVRLQDLTITGDAGNEQLMLVSKLKQIRLLSVSGSVNLSDAGLVHLHGMTTLAKIHLIRTNVTAAGAARLQTALPNCEIKWKGEVANDEP